jgi:hypothetical protein
MRSLLAVLIASALVHGRTSYAETAQPEGAEQYDPLYGVNLAGAGHDSSVPSPPPSPLPISTVEALDVATFDRHVHRSELPWLVLYVSCAPALPCAELSGRSLLEGSLLEGVRCLLRGAAVWQSCKLTSKSCAIKLLPLQDICA